MRASPRSPVARSRTAFTLVEMLVVIGIIVLLAALAVLILPSLQNNQRVASGADVVQGQLFIAKQMALRDQQPRGVRLIPGNGGFTSLQLIEQPAPYTAGVVTGVSQGTNGGWTVTFANVTADFAGAVQAGDLLDLSAAGDTYSDPVQSTAPALHLITQVGAANAANGTPATVSLASAPQSLSATSPWTYRILRSPRAMIGENPVNLPTEIAVAMPAAGTGSLIPQDTFSGQYDILFDSSGKLLRDAGNQGKVVLWVRDVSATPAGGDTLIAVYSRTGGIVSQPVSPGTDPYAFVKDGATAGM